MLKSGAVIVFGETVEEVQYNKRVAQAAPKMLDLLRRLSKLIVNESDLQETEQLLLELTD